MIRCRVGCPVRSPVVVKRHAECILVLVAVLLGTIGCQPVATPQPGSGSPSATTPARRKPQPDPDPVTEDAFPSVEAAVIALTQASESKDQKERLRVSKWLAMRGPAAVAPMADLLDDPATKGRTCIAACRVLGQIGPPAQDALIRHATNEKSYIRLNAIDQMGVIKPSTSEIVTTLIAAIDHQDPQTRITAMQALAYVGPPAKRAAPKLLEILNSGADDAYRNQAKKALVKINPRRTFED